MRGRGIRARRSWQVGTRKAADYLIMARFNDRALGSLIASFPNIVGMSSGEAREIHVTIFGPFLSKAGSTVIRERIRASVAGLPRLSCTVGDLIRLKGMRGGAIAMGLLPGKELTGFYHRMVSDLPPYYEWCTWIDSGAGNRIFHVSLRFNIPFREFDEFWERSLGLPASPDYQVSPGKGAVSSLRTYLHACDSPIDIFRIAVMRRGSLYSEYDLPRMTWLSRRAAGDPGEWSRTYQAFREQEGMELCTDAKGPAPDRFVISDLHLGHQNIIQYCRRPFTSAEEMDRVLIRNWNFRISPKDEVFYLGDLCHGKGAALASGYLGKLNGSIHVVLGNHDVTIPGAVQSLPLQHAGMDLFLVHDPLDAPPAFPGWILHGHHHNNDTGGYPFINGETRMVNVSAELLGYVPLSISELCGFLEKAARNDRVGSLGEARQRYS